MRIIKHMDLSKGLEEVPVLIEASGLRSFAEFQVSFIAFPVEYHTAYGNKHKRLKYTKSLWFDSWFDCLRYF